MDTIAAEAVIGADAGKHAEDIGGDAESDLDEKTATS